MAKPSGLPRLILGESGVSDFDRLRYRRGDAAVSERAGW
jgi:hypothetical protein